MAADPFPLTLDHYRPNSDNDEGNLVTSCRSCNSARRDMSAHDFLRSCSPGVEDRLKLRRRALPLDRAKQIAADPPPWLVALRTASDTRSLDFTPVEDF